jgi:hypothetical protein
LLYTPTNRDCRAVLSERIEEVQWANERDPGSSIFCLIEHNLASSLSAAHLEAMRSARKGKSTPVLHLTSAARSEFVDTLIRATELTNDAKLRLDPLLNPAGVSYGAGPNTAYLLAATLGSWAVHRRDSDVQLDKSRPNAYPIELELAAIGRRIEEIPYEIVGGGDGDHQRSVKVVGTGTFGDATFDRRDLFAAGDDFIVAFQRLGRPGIPDSEIRSEALAYLREEPEVRYESDFYEIDVDGQVEMESCCICQFHLVMPEMPTDILGCDYMTKDIPWQVGELILYHSRKMNHIYNRERAEQVNLSESVEYALRDLMYIQMGRVWRTHNDRFRASPHRFFSNGLLDNQLYARSFRDAAKEQADALRDVRVGAEEVYSEAAMAAPDGAASRLARVSEAIHRSGSELDRHVVTAVDDFGFLVEMWPELIRSAQSLDAMTIFRRMNVLMEDGV